MKIQKQHPNVKKKMQKNKQYNEKQEMHKHFKNNALKTM